MWSLFPRHHKRHIFFYHIAADREPCAAPRKWLALVFVPLISICCLSPHFPFVAVFFLVCFFLFFQALFCLFFFFRDETLCLHCSASALQKFDLLPGVFFFWSLKRRGCFLKKKTTKLYTHLGLITVTNKPVFSTPAFTHGGIVPLNTLGFGAQPT